MKTQVKSIHPYKGNTLFTKPKTGRLSPDRDLPSPSAESSMDVTRAFRAYEMRKLKAPRVTP